MTDRICVNCDHFVTKSTSSKYLTCRLGYEDEDVCTNFKVAKNLEQRSEEAPANLKGDRQYWLMIPDTQETNTYLARCFSTLRNTLDFAETMTIPLNKILIVSARNLKLRLEVEDPEQN